MYNYWADTQKGARNWSERLRHYASFLPSLAEAALVTISVSLAAMITAMTLGLVVASGHSPSFRSLLASMAGYWLD